MEKAKEKANAPIISVRPVVEVPNFDVEKVTEKYPDAQPVQTPVSGQVIWQIDLADASTAPVVGTQVKEGDVICFIQAYYGIEEVKALKSGKIVQIETKQGAKVQKNQILAFID